MSGTIPQQKVVVKNGKQFVQTFHVKPDNASSAAVARATGRLPQLNPSTDFEISPAAQHALDIAGRHGTYGNPEDFVNGFEQAYSFGSEDPKTSLDQYLKDNDPDEVHQVAFGYGFRAGQIAKLGEDRENYLTKGGRFSTDHRSGKIEGDFSKKVMMHNPFKKGDSVVIPAGTPYRSMSPSVQGTQYTKRATTIKTEYPSSGYSDAAVGWLVVAMPTVRAAGTGGYWKDYTVTPEMIEANGHELKPGDLGDYAEVAFRGHPY